MSSKFTIENINIQFKETKEQAIKIGIENNSSVANVIVAKIDNTLTRIDHDVFPVCQYEGDEIDGINIQEHKVYVDGVVRDGISLWLKGTRGGICFYLGKDKIELLDTHE